MSASFQRNCGDPAHADVSDEPSQTIKNCISQYKASETPRTVPILPQIDRCSNVSDGCRNSTTSQLPGSVGQEMPAMKLEPQAKHLSSLFDSGRTPDDDSDGESCPNYVLSSANDRLTDLVDVRPMNNWYSPAIQGPRDASETSAIPSIQLQYFSPHSESLPERPMQDARCDPTIRLKHVRSTASLAATGPDVKHGAHPTDLTRPSSYLDHNASQGNPTQLTKSALYSEDLLCFHDKLSKVTIKESENSAASYKEMKKQPKQDCCIGIGSWSNDSRPPVNGAKGKVMGDRTDSLRAELYEMFDRNWLENVAHCPNGQQGQRPSRSAASQPKIAAKSSPSTSAFNSDQTFSQEHSTDEDDSEEEAPKRRRRRAASGDSEANGPKLLACPFNKNDPHFFSALNGTTFRCCAGPGFESIARVKAHLYRLHRTPIMTCPSCGVFLNVEELNEHVRSRTCDNQPIVSAKFITNEMQNKLKSRKRTGLSVGDKWKEMYQLIFPKEVVPSPYYEQSEILSPSFSEFAESEDHEAFLFRELRHTFREALDVAPMPQLPDRLKDLLMTKLSDCQKQVSSMYHNAQQQNVALESTSGTDVTAISTPRALSNGFEPHPNLPTRNLQHFDQPNINAYPPLSWNQILIAPSIEYGQFQERQNSHDGSMDFPHPNSRDSGYGNSIGRFSDCSGYSSHHDFPDVNRNSFDEGARATPFANAFGLISNSHEATASSEQTRSDILTAVPRSDGNFNSLDFIDIYESSH